MEEWLARWVPRLPDRERTRVLLLGVLMGVLGGVSAGLFDGALVLIGRLALGTDEPAMAELAPVRALLAAVFTSLLAGAVGVLGTRLGRPQGIAEVIAGVRTRDHTLDAREGLVSAAAAAIAVGGGQSAGREGPIVQLAGSVAASACDRLGVPRTTARYLVAAGAAAGIAASFNSPLGGAFFAMESLLGTFALEAFAPIVVASVVGTVIGQAMLGDRLAVALPPFELGHPVELLVYPLLGLACGLVAIAFRALTRLAAEQLERVPGPKWARPLVPGLVVGLLAAVGLPQVMGNGYGFLEVMIREDQATMGFLVLLVAAKLVASAVAVASKSGGGMFAPTLFLGAVTGEIVGASLQTLFPDLVPHRGALATVGMGAVAAAVAHTPVTMTLMLFEMVGNYEVVLPLLVTIAIANVMAHAADRHSIYVQNLLDRGVKVDSGREELVLHDLRVKDVMRTHDLPILSADAPFGALAEQFLTQRGGEVFVVDAAEGGPRLVGQVDIHDIKALLAEPARRPTTSARGLARPCLPVGPDDDMAVAMERFFRTGAEVLPVVGEGDRLVGVLAERDVVGALNREILRQDVLMARVEHGGPNDRHTDFVELPEGFSIEVVAPGPAVGQTLLGLELPRRFGVTVLAVDVWDEARQAHVRVPPTASTRLGERDRLVLLGPTERLKTLPSATLVPPEAARDRSVPPSSDPQTDPVPGDPVPADPGDEASNRSRG